MVYCNIWLWSIHFYIMLLQPITNNFNARSLSSHLFILNSNFWPEFMNLGPSVVFWTTTTTAVPASWSTHICMVVSIVVHWRFSGSIVILKVELTWSNWVSHWWSISLGIVVIFAAHMTHIHSNVLLVIPLIISIILAMINRDSAIKLNTLGTMIILRIPGISHSIHDVHMTSCGHWVIKVSTNEGWITHFNVSAIAHLTSIARKVDLWLRTFNFNY